MNPLLEQILRALRDGRRITLQMNRGGLDIRIETYELTRRCCIVHIPEKELDCAGAGDFVAQGVESARRQLVVG